MTTVEIVAKLREYSKFLDQCCVDNWGGIRRDIDAMADEIEAASTPQVTPAKAAAAYREVEEQGDDEAQMGRLLRNLRMMADDWGKSAVFLAGQPENRIEPCVKESATSRAAAYRHCSKLIADIIEQYGGQEAPE